MRAVDLFGGENKIEEQIAGLVRKKLRKLKGSTRELLEEALYLKKGTLCELDINGDKIDISLFEVIGATLGISAFQAFGKPKWDGDIAKKRFWKKEWKKKPMYRAAFCGTGRVSGSRIPLDMYVTFRAIQEMRARKSKKEGTECLSSRIRHKRS